MTVWVAAARAQVHRLVSVVKMATMLEKCSTESSVGGLQDSMQRIFIKKYFLVNVGSVGRAKRFTTVSRNYLKGIRKPRMMPDQVYK
jgi:hypothetical protein